MSIKVVTIADTHGRHDAIEIPDGDVFIHAGDITAMSGDTDLSGFNDFLGELPHPTKILIAGNHDFCFERDPEGSATVLTNCLYLQDQAAVIEGVQFYGSPWQPWFYDWAFNLQRGEEIRAKWDLIPEGTHVLITHGPPYGQGDLTTQGMRVGCRDLLEAVERIRPCLHVFGHIHEGYGVTSDALTTFVNASVVDRDYRQVHPPVVCTIDVAHNRVIFE